MRIVFVQTYPVYHDGWTTEEWLRLENRDRWMPGLAALMGHEVELWAVAENAYTGRSALPGFGGYMIRLFRPDRRDGRTKRHTSRDLCAYAAGAPADVYVLKGTDGGVGLQLIADVLRPRKAPFAFVIGGKYYAPPTADACAVFYETERQRRALESPGLRLWRRAVAPEALFRLPKSIDTDVFRPREGAEVRWDLITVSRLIPRHKPLGALGALSEHARVAVLGSGPMEAALRARYPRIAWLGRAPNREVPAALGQARAFMHAGLSDYYPRVLVEAAACGLPCIAFREAIDEDVLPPEVGLRVSRRGYLAETLALLADEARLAQMGRAARARAVAAFGPTSTQPALAFLAARVAQLRGAAAA